MGGAYVNVRPYYPFPRIRTNSSHVLRTSWHPHSWIRGTNGQDTRQIMTKKLLEDFWNKLSSLNEFLLEKISSCIEEFYLAVKEKKEKERKNGKSVPSLFSCSPIFFRERKFLCSGNRRINISTLLTILLPSSSLQPPDSKVKLTSKSNIWDRFDVSIHFILHWRNRKIMEFDLHLSENGEGKPLSPFHLRLGTMASSKYLFFSCGRSAWMATIISLKWHNGTTEVNFDFRWEKLRGQIVLPADFTLKGLFD